MKNDNRNLLDTKSIVDQYVSLLEPEGKYLRLKRVMDSDPFLFRGLTEERETRFKRWLPSNTHVYEAFVEYARELKYANRRNYYSARAIWERLRWDTMVHDKFGGDTKLSDVNMPFVSWLSMAAEPDLRGMFKKRIKREDIA